LAFFMWGCNETLEPQVDRLGFNHFPLDTGNFRIYDVERVEFLFSGEIDTSNFQLKEVIANARKTANGETIYDLERFTRDSEEENWQLDSVWTARRTSIQAIVVENNVPFVKLTFPIDENKTWDGNVLNIRPPDEYTMVNLFNSFLLDTADAVSFENTITVVQNDLRDPITRIDVRKEVYAENIGLIYKETEFLLFCADPDCLGQGIVEVGTILKQQLIDFGEE